MVLAGREFGEDADGNCMLLESSSGNQIRQWHILLLYNPQLTVLIKELPFRIPVNADIGVQPDDLPAPQSDRIFNL